MTKSARLFLMLLSSMLLASFSYVASAGIVITGTRVIYPSDAREISVKMSNKGKRPVLIQSWIDEGDPKAKPETIHVPFVLTPPINRVEPDKGQTLRISYTGKPLPTDRESIFWLNVLEIPAKNPLLKEENYLQMAFRTRIKLFFRPITLAGNANDAAKELLWQTDGRQLTAKNNSPYYVSLVSIEVNGKKTEADLISPFAEAAFKAGNTGDKILVTFVNDYGAVIDLEAQIK